MPKMTFAQYRTHFAGSHWQQTAEQLTTDWAAWLLETGSLTEKLLQQGAVLTVQITEQDWLQAASFAEDFAEQTAWVREVILKCDGKPAIFAQTILPKTTVEAVAEEVLSLGEKPIGLWLFPQNPQRICLEWTQHPETGLYARRSMLQLKGYPLAIYELFLPEFPFAPSTYCVG